MLKGIGITDTHRIDRVMFNRNPFLYQLKVVFDDPWAEQTKIRSSPSRNGDFCFASSDCRESKRKWLIY